MKSKSKSSTKPIYSAQIEGAANNVNSAYQAQAPKISAATDMLGSFLPSLQRRFEDGDPGVNAAQSYDRDVLSGKYLDEGNPYLDQMISRTNNDVSNSLAARLGTRGLSSGSTFADIIGRAVADNANGLRFNNYNTERGRMDQAAGRAPSLASASYLPLASMMEIAQAQQMPIQSAAGAGSAIGGLLGQYTNTKQTQKGSLGQLIAQMAGNAAQAYAMGG